MKNFKKDWKTIAFIYYAINVIVLTLFYPFIPKLLNYPPNSINNQFQIEINGLTYTQQYLSIFLMSFIVETLGLLYAYFSLKKYVNLIDDCPPKHLKALYYKTEKKIASTPKLLYLLQVLITVLCIIITFQSLGGGIEVILNCVIVFASILLTIATISYIFTKNIFKEILINLFYKVYDDNPEIFNRIKRTSAKSLVLSLVSSIMLVSIVFITFMANSSESKAKGDLLYDLYDNMLYTELSDSYNSSSELEKALKNLSLYSDLDSFFIVKNKKVIYTSNGEDLSDFFIKYIYEVASENSIQSNRTYDFYALSYQGVFKNININGVDCLVGIRYSVSNSTLLKSIVVVAIVLLILTFILVNFALEFMFSDIKLITKRFNEIAKSKNAISNSVVPIYSNDEIGDLAKSFNRVSGVTVENVNQLKDNQTTLMEKERLASLGQMIGGVAHNLKTPIMSIAGATEGLDDLIVEYSKSINDPEVTVSDHQQIADEMKDWVSKIRMYDSYMSDIITAVKGQAVNMNDSTNETFTIEEMINRVNILMKHELKEALVTLNVDLKIDKSTTIFGNINSLVQVIDNLIQNSIQSFGLKDDKDSESKGIIGKMKYADKHIDLIIDRQDLPQSENSESRFENFNIVITVQDNGSGIPKEVQDKLFKQMITTKGHNGSGLGLFMSYSTIKGNFNGSMTFESEVGKGTTFTIVIPRR